MKLWTLTGTAAALLILPALSQAEFNYTTAEANYLLDVEFDGDLDGDGLGIGGSYEIAESFFIFGSYEDFDLDFDINGDWLELGGGYFHELNEDLDFVATVSYVDVELSSNFGSADDDALGLGGGIRAKLADSLEVDAMLEYYDFDEGDSDTSLELRGRYYFSPEFAVQLKMNLGADIETIAIGVRGEFGGSSASTVE
jgi:opacity protein-like surface antigen